MDCVCLQETWAVNGGALPVDQPYQYDGPSDIGGCEAGFLVHQGSTSWSLNVDTSYHRIRWRCIASSQNAPALLLCSFYAPHVGVPLPTRIDFWSRFRASIQDALRHHPHANLVLAGDCNVYLAEVMGPERERSNEPQLRDLIRALCHDFGLRIANPPRVSTHRSGSCIDIVLVSRPLDVVDIVVHDGDTCGCQRDSCHPIVGSDHKLITFKIAVPPEADDVVPKPWPRVRNWHSVVQDLHPQLLQWASKVLNLRQGQPLPLPERRGVLDLLYAEFVAIVWQAAEPHASSRSGGNRRPQPDWWDDACYELLVARNAAWRQWRREQTSSARETFRQKRLEFHHLVRRKKSSFWSSWLSRQESLSRSNPRLAARNVRTQMGQSHGGLPRSMRSAGHRLEGDQCLAAWRDHFRNVPSVCDGRLRADVATDSASAAASSDITSRAAALRRDMASLSGPLDFPLSAAELQHVLSQLPSHRAPGPDGLPYEFFAVKDDVLSSALLTFFELVRHWAVVPSIWRSARVSPLHKGGPADDFNNYRPISLLCCSLKIFERLLLARLLPRVDPQLDECQAGFRWGAEEQIYTLAETLRLRARKRTFCAFVDVRKAFDVAWRDAVLVRLAETGVSGSMWSVIADLLCETTARVRVNGLTSQPWTETAGVRQGSVLGPLLFNILFNGIADAVRAVCPGVALGPGPSAPRVTLLLYADDLVILADDAATLQRALDAIGNWGARWRFSFGIGPEKTAVMVVGSRLLNFHFSLQGCAVPCVPHYTYLGVTFAASRKWRQHETRLIVKSTRRFYQFLGWAENRQLHTGFRNALFQTYVLPSTLYGTQFLDSATIVRLDKVIRQWGRRLLQWPSGAPGAAVLGELGWAPFLFQVKRLQFGLFGRLSATSTRDVRRGLAARVFNFALSRPGSWAYETAQTLHQDGVMSPASYGVLPGSGLRRVWQWTRHQVVQTLQQRAHASYRADLLAVPSLANYAVYQPRLHCLVSIHSSGLPISAVREWTLARCGHHPFTDGRSARHSHRTDSLCLCGDQCNLLHAIRACPLLASQRRHWLTRLGLQRVPQFGDDELLRWIFDPSLVLNSRSSVNAHVHYVAAICQIARNLLAGLQL